MSEIRERLVGAVESSRLARPIGRVGETALHGALNHYVENGGLAVVYTNGRMRNYGNAQPELVINLHSNEPILRLAVDPSLAICEGYIHGQIDFEDPTNPAEPPRIDKLIKILAANGAFGFDSKYGRLLDPLRAATQPNRKDLHEEQIQDHYDIGQEFYDLWLDDSRLYSCAYWGEKPEEMTLAEAQQRKIDHTLRKLELEPGQKVLEIGSGWGALAIAAAEQYGVDVYGITLSKDQLAYCRRLAEERGVSDKVRFYMVDYEDLMSMPKLEGFFDRTYSIGMFEHVGKQGADKYFATQNYLLKPGGKTLNHAISQVRDKDPTAFIRKYVFRGGYLHPIGNVLNSAARNGFRDADVEHLRRHYALTLGLERGWWGKFEEAVPAVHGLYEAGKIRHPYVSSSEEFVRMWRLYLALSYGSFQYGQLDINQTVLTKGIDNNGPLTRDHVYPQAA